MKICKTIPEITEALKPARLSGKTIGFVPTMGALHQGHLNLIHVSNQACDITVASIFVNPTQFNNVDDLSKYPKTLDEDVNELTKANCDLLFLPSDHDIYPQKPSIKIVFDNIVGELEGRFRPGHFDGVALVVSKLFNIIQPDEAFFGQKDIQQFFVVKSLIDQLNFHIKLNMVQTAREPNGLAMSSRNKRLSTEEREEATLLVKALRQSQTELLNEVDIQSVKHNIQELFRTSNRLNLEYFEVVNTDDFKPLKSIANKEKVAICIAAEIGKVRLIDNLMLIS